MKPKSKGPRQIDGGQARAEESQGETRGARLERREEIQRVLVETMRGILEGRIKPAAAYAIGRSVQAELRLLRMIEQPERMMEKEKAAAEAKKARAQRTRRKESRNQKAEGGTQQGGPKGWVN